MIGCACMQGHNHENRGAKPLSKTFYLMCTVPKNHEKLFSILKIRWCSG